MLPGHPSGRVWPLHGRLDRHGQRLRAHSRADYLCDRRQRDAISLPTLLARGAAQLGLLAPAAALAGTLGCGGDFHAQLLRQTLLLLLQVLQLLPAQRRGGREEREPGGVRQSSHVIRQRSKGNRDAVLNEEKLKAMHVWL